MNTTVKIKKATPKLIKKEKQSIFLNAGGITKNEKMNLTEIRKSLWR